MSCGRIACPRPLTGMRQTTGGCWLFTMDSVLVPVGCCGSASNESVDADGTALTPSGFVEAMQKTDFGRQQRKKSRKSRKWARNALCHMTTDRTTAIVGTTRSVRVGLKGPSAELSGGRSPTGAKEIKHEARGDNARTGTRREKRADWHDLTDFLFGGVPSFSQEASRVGMKPTSSRMAVNSRRQERSAHSSANDVSLRVCRRSPTRRLIVFAVVRLGVLLLTATAASALLNDYQHGGRCRKCRSRQVCY